MIPVPGETPGAWWGNTGSEQARTAAARKGGYGADFDLSVYFLHDVPPEVLASGTDQQFPEAKAAFRSVCVYAEDLCVSGLARTRLARSVHDAGWSQLLRLIEEKAARYGRTFARIGRFEPTSQVCSACGAKDGPKPLDVREWTCAACGTAHDRDVNAAKNILAAGRADNSNACRSRASDHASWQPALKQEPTGARREPRWRNPRRSQRGGRQDRFFPAAAAFQQRLARERLEIDADVLPGGHLIALAQPAPLTGCLLHD